MFAIREKKPMAFFFLRHSSSLIWEQGDASRDAFIL